MTRYTPKEAAQVAEDLIFWKAFEHRNWRLMSYTDRDEAKFGWLVAGYYAEWVIISKPVVNFLRAVPPDVIGGLSE